MKHRRNELKRKALAVFENRGWLNVPAWATISGYYPIRSAYKVLKRFHRWRLLECRLDARGLLLYHISDRGRARLAWLRKNKGKTVKVALYARISTTDKGQDPELQLRELRARGQVSGWEIVGEYVDRGVSGAKERRPELDRLIKDANRGAFEIVAVWKLDRFGRSLRHLVNALAEFEARGIAFVSLRDNIDLSTPAGRLMFQIIGAMAEFERALIVERVRAGLAVARAKGRRLGRPTVHVDASKIASLRAQGCSWRKIATELGIGVGTAMRVADRTGNKHLQDAPEGSACKVLASTFPISILHP